MVKNPGDIEGARQSEDTALPRGASGSTSVGTIGDYRAEKVKLSDDVPVKVPCPEAANTILAASKPTGGFISEIVGGAGIVLGQDTLIG